MKLVVYRGKVLKYFHHCPLCGKEGSVTYSTGVAYIDLSCKNCGAKWNAFIDVLLTFQWAKLTKPSSDGKGSELVGKEYHPEFWEEMASKTLEKLAQKAPKETKKVSATYCSSCGTRLPPKAAFCPSCGQKVKK